MRPLPWVILALKLSERGRLVYAQACSSLDYSLGNVGVDTVGVPSLLYGTLKRQQDG